MKTFLPHLLASVAITTFSSGADASQEIPLAATYDWSGAYAGAYVAGIIGNAGHTISVPGASIARSSDDSGVLGGIQLGYDWQFNKLVVGVVADIGTTDFNVFVPAAAFGGGIGGLGTELDYVGTARARVGYAFGRLLTYAHGGLAYAGAESRIVTPIAPLAPQTTFNKTKVGYTAGAGMEYAITDGITVQGQYAFTDLGNDTYYAIPVALGGPGTVADDVDFHTINFAINFRF